MNVFSWINCLNEGIFSLKNCWTKELSHCHKLWFSNLYIFVIKCRRPLIFQTMNSVRWKNQSLKYQRFPPTGGKNVGIRKSEFVTKTQFLWSQHLKTSKNLKSQNSIQDCLSQTFAFLWPWEKMYVKKTLVFSSLYR